MVSNHGEIGAESEVGKGRHSGSKFPAARSRGLFVPESGTSNWDFTTGGSFLSWSAFAAANWRLWSGLAVPSTLTMRISALKQEPVSHVRPPRSVHGPPDPGSKSCK